MNPKILIIDDEESIRFTAEKFLIRQGFEVLLGDSYEQAIESVSTRDVEVIVSDIVLGGSSGIDFLREIKKRGIRSPVIMMTGKPNLESASEAVRLGAFDYLAKPFTYDVLLRIINRALKHKMLDDEKESFRRNLEAIFMSVAEGFIVIDNTMSVTQANDNIESFFNCKPSDIIGKNFAALDHPARQMCADVLQQTLQTREKVFDLHTVWQDKAGNKQSVAINGTPLFDRDRKFIGALLVLRDTTRIVHLEKELKERYRMHRLIGKSKPMQEIYTLIDDLTDTDATILITGESGTGKELVAEAIHYTGSRADRPLVKVNCSALSENLLESELFGHVSGAFTGAIKDKIGRFQLADGGTLLLDEIGDISLALQLKLLRVLQEKEFERVGDSRTIKSNVRVIAATNADLTEKISRGSFRKDLYYRLNVMEIVLPPLRERLDDIPLLVEHFCSVFNKKFKKIIEGVSGQVINLFMHYSWPGNVRELEHILERAFIVCRDTFITPDHVRTDMQGLPGRESPQERSAEVSNEHIMAALDAARWNKKKAAALLGIHRSTLHRKLKELNLDIK